MADNITLPRDHFLALVRRIEDAERPCSNTITIPIDEYESLRNAVAEYQALKEALVNAGTPVESIDLLINATREPLTPTSDDDTTLDGTTLSSRTTVSTCRSFDKQYWTKAVAPPPQNFSWGKSWRPSGRGPAISFCEDEESSCIEECMDETPIEPQQFQTCRKDRSLVLTGLSKDATLIDVLKHIRGGAILNVFLKRHDQTAHVSFVESAGAESFINHVKRNDLYINSKRITIAWSEKQYYMTGGIARRIFCNGATRNLVIRFPKPEVTEKIVRDDLEHIHLLEVVSVTSKDGHFWISLNGVTHAVTARGCMMSRSRYKSSRIEFWQDECAQALPTTTTPRVLTSKPSNHKVKSSVNRFDVLLSADEW
ncbi:hypothetical protein LTS08_001603 [Lithohypha guttulata]|uniref:uncharacterized protein n=1 Tax=Lithohypha guttulata TaxID=1690604 RepID=UPI002DDE702B|nr:hypothetical protein LTR51_003730 [Lithohypha guttulata]KAK5105326.1 hypothetical protein LTS08_001603 [Lithohypha guttulata]